MSDFEDSLEDRFHFFGKKIQNFWSEGFGYLWLLNFSGQVQLNFYQS